VEDGVREKFRNLQVAGGGGGGGLQEGMTILYKYTKYIVGGNLHI
jgi:hypothetical protein